MECKHCLIWSNYNVLSVAFNSLHKSPQNILNRNIFKLKLDIFFKTIEDTPSVPSRINSLLDLIKETVCDGYGVLT